MNAYATRPDREHNSIGHLWWNQAFVKAMNGEVANIKPIEEFFQQYQAGQLSVEPGIWNLEDVVQHYQDGYKAGEEYKAYAASVPFATGFESVTASVEPMDKLPPMSNPFHHDATNMGTNLVRGWMLMHEGFDHPEEPRGLRGFYLYNERSGQRIRIRLTPEFVAPEKTLRNYTVAYREPDWVGGFCHTATFDAEDAAHAGEQMENFIPDSQQLLVDVTPTNRREILAFNAQLKVLGYSKD